MQTALLELQLPERAFSGFVCPDCETTLKALRCSTCGVHYSEIDGIPILLSRDLRFQCARDVAGSYDAIYREHPNAWEREGRTAEFIAYFAALLSRFQGRRFLEIGCGEGRLLVDLAFGEKFAVELSAQAIRTARMRTEACFCVALAEWLPFPSDFFDVIASVGVMEHFLDIGAALRQIHRVLKPGGTSVVLTHVVLTVRERAAAKAAEHLFPRPRPVRLARWLMTRLRPAPKPDLILQPVQNRYTLNQVKSWVEQSGLKVREVITTRTRPGAPLMGPWVAIYIAQK